LIAVVRCGILTLAFLVMGKARESNDETLRNGTFAWRICNHGACS
jgi:hypothetical protein